VAAVALFAGSLVVLVVGSVEALGALSARTTIDLYDLPLGPTKREHVEMLERMAAEADVSLALLTPERSGTPDRLDAYVLRGELPDPVFWGGITERPARAIGDAVIAWTYAVDGSPSDVSRFLTELREHEFAFADATPRAIPSLVDEILTPGLVTVGVAVTIGALVALVAESHRRAARQRVRRLAGRASGRIAMTELVDVLLLTAAVFGSVFGVLSLFLGVRGAGEAVWAFSAGAAALVVAVAVTLVATTHVALMTLSGRRLDGVDTGRWRPAVTGASGLVLVAVITAGASSVGAENSIVEQLERSLAAEAEHGDDVVLGVGFSDEQQELALGAIGSQALVDGSARMAMTNAIPDALLVIGAGTPGISADVAHRDGVTVLIPQALAERADDIESTVVESVAEGWEVDDTDPPRTPSIRSEIVASTDAAIGAAGRWVDLGLQDGPAPSPSTVVVADVADIAPNRIATATRNGEVRFSDRAALVRALHRSGSFDVVTQVNRVGAVVDRRLADVRTERRVLTSATIAAAVAALFAGSSLVADHVERGRAAARVRSLVGRHPGVHHARFLLGAAGVCGATVFATLTTAAQAGATIVVASIGAAGLTVILLTALIIIDASRRKTLP
jgi:hypothetical protein